MPAARYRLKPPEVDALQYTRATVAEMQLWCAGVAHYADPTAPTKLYIDMPGGITTPIAPLDWVVRDADGSFSTYSPAEFAKRYELIP